MFKLGVRGHHKRATLSKHWCAAASRRTWSAAKAVDEASMTISSTSDPIYREPNSSERPLVSIIVLNFNGLSRLQMCFDAVIRQDYPNYEIIFVDNGSSDGSLEWASAKLSDTSLSYQIEALQNNQGLNRGKNRGASLANGKYLWLLDNDIAPETSTLDKLVTYMEQNREVALCGPMLTDFVSPGKIIGGGFRLRMLYGRNRPLAAAADSDCSARQVTYISGGIMLVTASAWRQLDGFEESSVFYLDDSDFGVRCWLAGFKVALVSGCSARHWDDEAGPRAFKKLRFRLHITGVTRFIIRNFSFFPLLIHLLTFELFLLMKTAKHIVREKHPGFLLDYFAAQYHCIIDFAETVRQRRIIQRSRRPASDIFLHLEDRDYPHSHTTRQPLP
jgi:GT2 family glycosyltransferase